MKYEHLTSKKGPKPSYISHMCTKCVAFQKDILKVHYLNTMKSVRHFYPMAFNKISLAAVH